MKVFTKLVIEGKLQSADIVAALDQCNVVHGDISIVGNFGKFAVTIESNSRASNSLYLSRLREKLDKAKVSIQNIQYFSG